MIGRLYDSDGTLLSTIEAVDDDTITYTTGSIGTWAAQQSTAGVEGTWSNMNLVTFENGRTATGSSNRPTARLSRKWRPLGARITRSTGWCRIPVLFRVLAYNDRGDTGYSNLVTATTVAATAVPASRPR